MVKKGTKSTRDCRIRNVRPFAIKANIEETNRRQETTIKYKSKKLGNLSKTAQVFLPRHFNRHKSVYRLRSTDN
jgi:hypothetical protein